MEEIRVNSDKVLRDRGVTSKELALKLDITEANMLILRTGKAKGIRFNTLVKICKALNCQPGDILEFEEI